MSKERVEEFVARNAKYAQTHEPSPHLADVRHIVQVRGSTVILTCSDPRVTPEEFFDLHRLEAAVIRNAGGRSVDSVRSLQALDTIANIGAIIVVHHTDCGGLLISDEDIYKRMLERNPEEAKKIGRGKFSTFGDIGLEESIRQDVEEIKKMPFLRKDLYVVGYSLDIDTGLLKQVVSHQGPSL